MKNINNVLAAFAITLCVSFLNCGGSTTTTTDTGLRLNVDGDFDTSASASFSALTRYTTTGTCDDLDTPITQDDPILTDGLDCDADDGVVAHVTPSTYALAIKRATLLGSDENTTDFDLIADTGTLALSEVVSFTEADSSTTMVTIDPADLAAGTYSGVEVELYYFQMTFEIAGTDATVRIYMSDDDFDAEGNLGHHQGDITMIDDNGDELGWIDSTWLEANLSDTRGEAQNGAGGTDAETDHDRGFFGNEDFWNQEELSQGAAADIFITELDFDTALEIPDPDTITTLTTITATFSIADTFFYEDFAPQDTGFFPDTGGEATSEGSAWAPLAPTAVITVSE